LPERGERIVIVFPKSKSGSLSSQVLDHLTEPRLHLLLAAPLIDGEVTAAAKGEAILMRWQSAKGMHTLPGTVDGFVNNGVAAWRVGVDAVDPGDVGVARGPVEATGPIEANGTVPATREIDTVASVEPVGHVEAADGSNRRRHIRVSMQRRVDVIAAGMRHTVESIDISESGIRCRWRGDPFWKPAAAGSAIEGPFQKSSSVTVCIDTGSGHPLTLPGSIVRVRRGGQGVEFSVAFSRLSDSVKKIQMLRRYIVTLERRQLRRDQIQ